MKQKFKEKYICKVPLKGDNVYAIVSQTNTDTLRYKLYHDIDNFNNGEMYFDPDTNEIDCFNGFVNKETVILPILKKLEEYGFSSNF